MTAKKTGYYALVIALIFSCTSCHTVQDYPKYDKVLVYSRPYDVTFLRAMEALNTVSGWTLEQTDKEKGFIVARNREYGHLFDKDKWVAKFWVKRVDRKHTSVELDTDSQRLKEGGRLLERIDQVMKATSPQLANTPVS